MLAGQVRPSELPLSGISGPLRRKMAASFFRKEVKKLRLVEGQAFHGAGMPGLSPGGAQ
jgi:hypothetical protein